MIFKSYFRQGFLKGFLIKGKKNIFVLGVPKVLWEGVNNIFGKKIHRGICNQKLVKEISGMGCQKIF